MFNVVLFTHDDLDGAGCAILFNLFMRCQENIDYKIIHCSNNGVDEKIRSAIDDGVVVPSTVVYFADICPGEEMAEYLDKMISGNIKVWDHHKTSSYISTKIHGAKIVTMIEPGKLESGTSLMYRDITNYSFWDNDKFRLVLLYNLADAIRSYDTYEWKQTGNVEAQRLNALFRVIGMSRFVNTYVKRITDLDYNHSQSLLIEPVNNDYIDAYLENEQRLINSITLDDIKSVMIHGYRVAVHLTSGGHVSETGNQFLINHPEFDVYMAVMLPQKEYSFRTIRDDIDLGKEFAKPIGGGGHPRAAGSPIPESVKEEIFNILIKPLSAGS